MSKIVHLRDCEELKNPIAYKQYQYFKTFPEIYTSKVNPYPFFASSKRITFHNINNLSCDFQFNYIDTSILSLGTIS